MMMHLQSLFYIFSVFFGALFFSVMYVYSSTGGLLDKAIDLGERLLVAFDTPTSIPYLRVGGRE